MPVAYRAKQALDADRKDSAARAERTVIAPGTPERNVAAPRDVSPGTNDPRGGPPTPLPPLIADPHLYDYIHDLRFADDGSVELVDGAGQVLTTTARGNYAAHEADNLITITFVNIVEFDSYGDNHPLRALPDFAARCTRETGRFAFREHVPWRINDPEAWPCLLFTERYIFEADPLDFATAAQAGNLYHAAEPVTTIDHARASSRIYYPRDGRRELPLRDLRALGIGDGDWLDERAI